VKRLLGLFLLLVGTYLAARVAVAHAVSGHAPASRPLALHAVSVPLLQLALLESVRRWRRSPGAGA
jgi:hypothetical protein